MKTDDTHKGDQPNHSPADGNTFVGPDGHTYRLLGESGLVEDEDGEMYSASEIFGEEEQSEKSASVSNSSSHTTSPSVFSSKPTHPDWYAMYDPRYCGPSLEDWINEMEKRYNNDADFRRGWTDPKSTSQISSDESTASEESSS
jgi:hypothetical protein